MSGQIVKKLSIFAVMVAVWTSAMAADDVANKPAKPVYKRPVLIRFEGEINTLSEQYMLRKIDEAKDMEADLLVVEIDSPGGTVDSSLNIAERLSDIDWAHTVAFVPRKAISGAAIISLGCDDIIMAPNGQLGDAGVIYFDEGSYAFRYAEDKYKTFLVSNVRTLAEKKGRPPALAEAFVDKELTVFRVEDTKTGDIAFMSDAEIESSDDPARWKKLKPVLETRDDRFLQVSGKRAVELKLAQGLAEDRDELKKHYGLEEDFVVLEPTAVDTVVYVLNLWLVTALLFAIGLIALYAEFSAPGIGLGGLIALLCFALFFWSRFLGGTAGWLEIVLFVSGLAFLGVELFILPGFGIAGLSGVLLMLAALILAGQKHLIPQTPNEVGMLTNTLLSIMVAAGLFAGGAYFISSYLGVIPVLNRLTLHPPQPEDVPERKIDAAKAAVSGPEPVVGDEGIADSFLRPAGKARFGNRYVDVITDGEYIAKGSRVQIVEISGNRMLVVEVKSNA